MKNTITGLIAPKGAGKTHKAVELMCASPRAAVFNIVRKDTQFLSCATHIFDGAPRALCETLGEESFRIVYRPVVVDADEQGNPYYPEFPLWVDLCMARGDMTAIIDEAHLLCDPHHIPPSLFQALALGRHEDLSLVYVTQSWSMVHRLLTKNSDEFYFWNIIEPSDVQGIRARCGSDIAERVTQLRRLQDSRLEGGTLIPGEFIHWTSWAGVEEKEEQNNDTHNKPVFSSSGPGNPKR